MFHKIKKFVRESREELSHVNWPARQEAIRLTTIVVGLSVGLAAFLGVFDYSFTTLVRVFIVR